MKNIKADNTLQQNVQVTPLRSFSFKRYFNFSLSLSVSHSLSDCISSIVISKTNTDRITCECIY